MSGELPKPAGAYRVVHLSDIHFPLVPITGKWHRLWDAVASRAVSQRPDAVVVTGDLIDSPFPAPHLAVKGLIKALEQMFPSVPLRVVLGNHDSKGILGVGPRVEDAVEVHRRAFGHQILGGWDSSVLGDIVHLYGVDSNHSPVLARGEVPTEALRAARLPADCNLREHFHLFVLHHHLIPEARRPGEGWLTHRESALGLDDSKEVLDSIARSGFDIALHGHRHLSTFNYHADPRSSNRHHSFWILGAPSATKAGWQGFNVIDFHHNGAFEAYMVVQSQSRWLEPILVASRDYESVRGLKWHSSRLDNTEPIADSLTVTVSRSDPDDHAGTASGDLRVTVKMNRGPEIDRHEFLRGGTVGFPLDSIVEYQGVELRGLRATAISRDGSGTPLNMVNDGIFDVSHLEDPVRVVFEAFVLNALPDKEGDWARMQGSQPGLQDLFLVKPKYSARVLSVRLDRGGVPGLQLKARAKGGAGRHEELAHCVSVEPPGEFEDGAGFMVVQPPPGMGYALTLGGADPLDGTGQDHGLSEPAQELRDRVTKLAELDSDRRRRVQDALDRVRAGIVASLLGQTSKRNSQRLNLAGDDITADLFGVGSGACPGIRVVMTDRATEIRAQEGREANPVGVEFPWGLGVAGLALRQRAWLVWSKGGRMRSFPTTWPASDRYIRKSESIHSYIYCGPVGLPGEPAAVALLSLASWKSTSLLSILAGVQNARERVQEVVQPTMAAVERFGYDLAEILL